MKLKAALLGSVAAGPASSAAQKMAARFEPGQSISLADGGTLHIVQKTASPTGLRFVVAGIGGQQHLSMRQLIDLGLVTPAMRHFANFVRMVVAYGTSIDDMVKTAIRGAGLPVDPTMDWSKYLNRVYGSALAKFPGMPADVKEDAIHDVVTHQLFGKPLKFDPTRQDKSKPLEKQVSAWLIDLFTHRKDDVVNAAQRAMGVGSWGPLGTVPTESIDQSAEGEDDMSNSFADIEQSDSNRDIEEYEGFDEIVAFLTAFQDYLKTTKNKQSHGILHFITQCYISGESRKEINQLIVGNPEFTNRKGQPFTRDNFNDAMALWVTIINEFAQDPNSPFYNSAIAKSFTSTIAKLPRKEHTASLQGLHLADVLNDPSQPQASPPPPAPPAPPAPPNPNVQQQLNVSQSAKPSNSGQGLNMAPAAQGDVDPNTTTNDTNNQPQEKHTIPPEIPGVNHTASSEESTMPVEKKAAPTKKASKMFARMQFIATKEPEAMSEALHQLASTFHGLGGKLASFQGHLDLTAAAPAADATIRQKVAARNQFGKGFRHLATEEPEEVANALNDFYSQLEAAVEDVEVLAENLGVALTPPEATEAVEAPEIPTEVPVPQDTPPEERGLIV